MEIKNILKINLVFFSLILIVHIVRIITNFQVKVNNYDIPLYFNYLGIIILIILISLNHKLLNK